jgi:type I restriction enzyme R subunit
VKPLECLLFMRNINSASYFEQMKGRGCRVVSSDDLQSVTPDARQKTHFVIVDAVGVCENDKTVSKPLDRKPTVGLEKILNSVAAGMVSDDIVSTLAARLARLQKQIEEIQAQEIEEVSGVAGGLPKLTARLLDSIDPDANTQRAVEKFSIPEGQEPTEEQVREVEREAMTEALRPFHNPRLRETILRAKSSSEQVIDDCPAYLFMTPVKVLGPNPAAIRIEPAKPCILIGLAFETNRSRNQHASIIRCRESLWPDQSPVTQVALRYEISIRDPRYRSS